MKQYNWSISTNSIYTNFDTGIVQAETFAEAEKKIKSKLEADLKKVNELLAPQNYTVSMDLDNVSITEDLEFAKTQPAKQLSYAERMVITRNVFADIRDVNNTDDKIDRITMRNVDGRSAFIMKLDIKMNYNHMYDTTPDSEDKGKKYSYMFFEDMIKDGWYTEGWHIV